MIYTLQKDRLKLKNGNKVKGWERENETLTIRIIGASLVAQLVKNPPAVRETWVPSLGQEDPLEEGKAPHSSILAWKTPWTA